MKTHYKEGHFHSTRLGVFGEIVLLKLLEKWIFVFVVTDWWQWDFGQMGHFLGCWDFIIGPVPKSVTRIYTCSTQKIKHFGREARKICNRTNDHFLLSN